MKTLFFLRRVFSPRRRVLLGSLILLPSGAFLSSDSHLFPRILSPFGLCLGNGSPNFQEDKDTLTHSWKGMLATEIARIRVASGRKGHSEKVKEILERDSNVVQLIKDNPAPARIIIIPKEFQEEGFVAAFASSQTASVDSSKVLYMHTQNTVMDPELVPSFLQYLSHQEFPSQSYLFILDAETLVDPHKNSSSLAEVASLFKDKPNLKTFIFTSLKTEREPQVHGTVVIDLFSYFREQAENYARV